MSCLVIDDSFKVRESELIKRINPSYFDSISIIGFVLLLYHILTCAINLFTGIIIFMESNKEDLSLISNEII